MNKRPLREITTEDIDAYRKDGVVCLRAMFDRDWLDRLSAAWVRVRQQVREQGMDRLVPAELTEGDPRLRDELREIYSAEAIAERRRRTPGLDGAKYMASWDDDFRAFVLDSPAAEIVGRVLDIDEVRFYWDQVFEKPPGSEVRTYWHNDDAVWPTSGDHLPSLWLPLTSVSEAQSLEYVPGSQHDRTDYWGRSWNSGNAERAGERPAERPDFLDYETRRGDPSIRFLKWAMEPGDVMLFHPRLYHGGGPNPDPRQPRIALSTRWFGDDVRWNPRIGDVNVPGIAHERMRAGERPVDDRLFPLAWKRGAA